MSVYPVLIRKARGFAAVVLGALFFLTACETVPGPGGQQFPRPQDGPGGGVQTPQTPDAQQTDPDEPNPDSDREKTYLAPPFLEGDEIKRIALLLPFSARSERLRTEAASMLEAAEMALFNADDDSILLIALDSAGTAQGAKLGAEAAVRQGADVILGPVLASSVKAAGQAAYETGIPVIAFSTDTSVSGDNVYLLSFPPEAETRRITQFAAEAGARKFAFLGPSSTYGRRVLDAYEQEITKLGGVLSAVENYSGKDITVMQDPAERLVKAYKRTGAYHAVLLPEGGTALRSLAPLLTYFDDDLRNVQILGTGLWHRDSVVREPALNGGVFAGPDHEAREEFEKNYDALYGQEPTRLASLAYDGINIAAYILGDEQSDKHHLLTDPAGFFGVDGLVRFAQDGTPQRGLAVYQIRNGKFIIIEPAPRSTDGAF